MAFDGIRAELAYTAGLRARDGNELQRATALFAKAQAGFLRAHYPKGVIRASQDLGDSLRLQGRVAEALEAFGTAMTTATAIRDRHGQANAANGMGVTLLEHDRSAGRTHFQDAHDRCPPDSEGQKILVVITSNLGRLENREGRPDRALRWLSKSRDLAERVRDQEGVIDALSEIAAAQMLLLDFPSAQATCVTLEETLDRISRPDLATRVFATAAKVNSTAKANETALHHVDRVLGSLSAAPQQDRLMALPIVADVCFHAGQLDKARQIADSGLPLIPDQLPRLRASMLLTRAKIALEEDDLPTASATIGELRNLAPTDSRLNAMVLALASELSAARGDTAQAEHFMADSLRCFHDVTAEALPHLQTREVGLLEWHTHVFRRLEDHAVIDGRPADAALASDRGRARLLHSQIAARLPSRANFDLAQITDPRRVSAELGATIVMYASGPGSPQRMPLARIYVISPSGHVAMRPVPDIEFDMPIPQPLVVADEDQRAHRIAQALLSCLPDLYATLIAPIEDLLPQSGSHVVIVPDSIVHHVPFYALHPNDGHMLIDRYTLSVVPSAAVLGALAHTAPTDSPSIEAAVIGSRGLDQHQLAPHMREVRNIAQIYKTAPLIDAQPETVRDALEAADIAHIAAHAELGTEYRFGSVPGALYLGEPNSADAALTATDIERLRLKARVVVLSACVSGLGQVAAEGTIGLARAFLAAGAMSVIASLWLVDTWSARALMADLHSELRRGQSPAQALRTAMLECRSKGQGPEHWAPFTLIGLP